MDDGHILLRAVLDEPEEDLCRLAYADWIEESGGDLERAELIRLQIERNRFLKSGALMNAEQRAIRERVQDLLAARKHDWFPEFHPTHSGWDKVPNLVVNRGFLDVIEIDVPQFGCALMRDLFTRHPLRKIRINGQWGSYIQWISSTMPKKLRFLELSGATAMTRSEASALISYAKYAGWDNTLEELSYDVGNWEARDFLLGRLPNVRIRNEGTLWSAENQKGNRTILERPILSTAAPPASEAS